MSARTAPTRVRVVVTASRGSFAGLADALAALGASVIELPLVSFLPPEDWAPFDRALSRIRSYGGIAVTSPRAAQALADRLPHPPCPVPVWTPGQASRAPLAGRFTTVHRAAPSPGQGAAEAVAEAMLAAGIPAPVLFPSGSLRRDALIERLEAAGIEVHPVVCYRTVLADPESARRACAAGDVLLLASPAAARLVIRACDRGRRPSLLAVGPTTAAACSAAGWPPAATADSPSVSHLVAALHRLIETAA